MEEGEWRREKYRREDKGEKRGRGEVTEEREREVMRRRRRREEGVEERGKEETD